MSRRGVALVGVLWAVAALSTAAAAAMATAVTIVRAAENRMRHTRAAWAAEGCAAAAFSRLDEEERAGRGLRALPATPLTFLSGASCDTRMRLTRVGNDSALAVVVAVVGRSGRAPPFAGQELYVVSAGRRAAVLRSHAW